MANILKEIYDATSDSTSKVGKVGKWLYPFNVQYYVRDAWRKYGKPFMTASNTGYSGPTAASSIGNLANTGFRRYV